MGITIYFKGKLNNPDHAAPIVQELEEIAGEMEWKYNIIKEDTDYFKGIAINPHAKSEPISFLFDKNGNTKDFRTLGLRKHKETMSEDNFVRIKTQYAPIDVHIAIIKLLKYLKKKYINDLRVIDDGCYWETEDKELLAQKISFLNEMMDKVANVLNTIKIEKNESKESIIEKIENALRVRFGDT